MILEWSQTDSVPQTAGAAEEQVQTRKEIHRLVEFIGFLWIPMDVIGPLWISSESFDRSSTYMLIISCV